MDVSNDVSINNMAAIFVQYAYFFVDFVFDLKIKVGVIDHIDLNFVPALNFVGLEAKFCILKALTQKSNFI